MTPLKRKPTDDSPQPPIQKVPIGKLPVELARLNVHALLLTNPNFFGNLAESPYKPVMQIKGNTDYESLGCVGYNPQLAQLRATINIKLASGYSGGLCSSGSLEYVRFYLSYDNGATWQDQGMKAVNVFDVAGPKPLEYAVSLQISPAEKFCFFQNLPKVRAILSWNVPPPAASPNWTPVWGDVDETQIQIEGFHFILLSTLLEEAKLKLPVEIAPYVDPGQPVELVAPKEASLLELHKTYTELKVPQHRYLAPLLAASGGHPVVGAVTNPPIHLPTKPNILLGGISDIDVSALVEAWLNTQGNTSFEQLNCVGLDANTSQLVGVLEVKQGSGYSGGPCTTGSKEFVAFWVDWGSGWQYTGTTSVIVHDYTITAPNHLDYNVFLPVDLLSHAKPCYDGPQTAKVRAVLSWNTPPSTTDPYAPVVWGNSQEGLILIPPGNVIGTGQQVPVLSAVGDVETSKIGSDGRITDAVTITTGVRYVNAPFGGRITLAGLISNATAGLKYRIMKAPHGTSAFAPVTNEPGGLALVLNTFSGGSWSQSNITVHADADGYYSYMDLPPNQFVEGNLLGVWNSTAADTGFAYDLRVDLKMGMGSDIPSNVVTVLINNQAPTAILAATFGECGKLAPGDPISGTFTATATDFGSFGFSILPPGPAHSASPVPASGLSVKLGGAIADPGVTGQGFTLDTHGMDPCGYSMTVGVYDRTNVNSGQTSNYNQASIGFCLQLPTTPA